MIRFVFGQVALALTALFLGGTLVLPYNGGYVLAYALMVLTLVLVVSLIIARGRWTIDAAGWCFIIAFACVGLAFTIDGDAPLMVNFLFLLAFIPLSSWLSRFAAPDSAAVISWIALVGTLVSGVTAVLETVIEGHRRADGHWSDPIWSAEAALVLGFLSLSGFPVMKTRWRFVLLLGPIIGLVIVLLSGSRGPLLAAPVIGLVLMFTAFRPWWKQIVALAVALIVAGAIALPFMPSAMKRVERTGIVLVQLFTTGGVEERSAGARIAFWHAGTKAFLARPLTGYGWSNRVDAAYEYLPDKGVEYEKSGSRLKGNHHLHADILDMGVSGGILGLAAYGLILLAPLLGAIRSVRDSQHLARLTGALVLSSGYAACGLTYLMFGYEFHTTLYVCLAAILIGFCRDAPPERGVSPGAT
jgi:O-antigen ligase